MPKIIITNRKKEVDVNPIITLLNNFSMKQVFIHTKCGGKGNCVLCVIKVLKGAEFMSPPNEREILSLEPANIKKRVRLACQSYASQKLELFIPDTLEEVKELNGQNKSK